MRPIAPLRLLAAGLCCALLSSPFLRADSATLSVPSGTLTWDEGPITIKRGDTTVIDLREIQFDYHAPSAVELVDTTADALTLKLTFPGSVVWAVQGNTPPEQTATLTISRHGDGFRFHAAPDWANQVTLNFADTGDHIFGLSSPLQPDNRHSPDLRDATVFVEVASKGENLAENYASAFSAFYLSSHGYGAFFDTFGNGRYTFAVNGRNQIHHETGTLDWVVFLGDDGRTIHRAYYDLIGAPKSLPLWAVGPVAWRDQNDGGAPEILDDIARFDDLRLPITAWFVDRPYSDGAHAWSHMNFNTQFAHPEQWIHTIREEHGLEFMTWTATAFFGDTPLPRHLPGGFTYADLSDPATITAFQHNLTELQHRLGVKGHKMDRADEHFPEWETWADSTIPRDAKRNTYAYLFAKVHDEALLRTWGDDQFTFARAAIHRAQPYLSAIWGGDPRSNWAGLQGNLANAMRASFMGFPVWGSDVGGYLGDGRIPADLYLRWLQLGVLSGLCEIKLDGSGGDGEDRMPWHYDEDVQAAFRHLLELRMALIPYLHSLANTSAQNGPLMQPLAYRHLDDPRTYAIWDEFYVGDGLLVAPIVTPGTSRTVVLPAGRWHRFDFASGIQRTLKGNQTITAHAAVEEIPLYVRANALLLTGDVYRGNSRTWLPDAPATLTVHAFPGDPGDTTTFTYLDSADHNSAKTITLHTTATGIRLTAPALAAATTVRVYQSGQVVDHAVPAGEAIDLTIE